jgi:hypothetical protein
VCWPVITLALGSNAELRQVILDQIAAKPIQEELGGRKPFPFVDQAQQDALGPNVVVIEPPG